MKNEMNKGQTILTVAMWMAGITMTGAGLLYNTLYPQIEANAEDITEQGKKIVALEVNTENIQKSLEKQEAKLDALLRVNNINPEHVSLKATTTNDTSI